MQELLTLGFLATFVATGESLSCEICEGFGDTCEGPLTICPPGFDSCAIVQGEATMGVRLQTVVKSCVPASNCEEGLIVINLGTVGTIVKKLTCCVGSQCVKAPPSLPPIPTTPNGKKCPACYAVHGLKCEEEMAECAGDENYCFELAGTTNLGAMTVTNIMKGCTNLDTCNDTLSGSGSFAEMSVVATAKCTLATGSASSVPEFALLFSQAVSGILLVKILT